MDVKRLIFMKILLKYAAVLLATCSAGFSDIDSEMLESGEDTIQALQNDEASTKMREEFLKSLDTESDDFTSDAPLTEKDSDVLDGLDLENSSLVPDNTYVDVELGESPQDDYEGTLELNPDLDDFIPENSQLVDIFSEFEEPSPLTDQTSENDNLGLDY